MKRRVFNTLLGGAAAATLGASMSHQAQAQNTPRVGWVPGRFGRQSD
jgi:hypothetical protein